METISVNFPSFGFTEYAMMAILQAILLGVSCIELSQANQKRSGYKQTEWEDIQKAGAIAFIGVLITLAAGLAAQFLQRGVYDTLLILVPFPFVVSWATYYKRGSQNVSFSALQTEVEHQYSLMIINCVRDNTSEGAYNFERLYVECLKRVQKPDTWAGALNLTLGGQRRLFSALGVTDLLGTFAFSEEKCRQLLVTLVDQEKIKTDNEGHYLYPRVTKVLSE